MTVSSKKKAHLHDDDYDELVQSGMSNENNKTHVYKKHITKNWAHEHSNINNKIDNACLNACQKYRKKRESAVFLYIINTVLKTKSRKKIQMAGLTKKKIPRERLSQSVHHAEK